MLTSGPILPGAAGAVHTYVANGIGFIALNRPQALNALSLPMIRTMRAALEQWRGQAGVHAVVAYSPHARAFCAGADVRELHELAQRGDMAACDRFFIEEYALDHAIFTYPKPYIALMNGIVMGGGMGLAQGAQRTGGLRVVTSSTQMAMPETRIGLFPDVGAGWFLARAPGAIGRYLAVTGATIGPGDALRAGLADTCIDEAALPRLLEQLQQESFGNTAAVVACVRQAAGPTPWPAPLCAAQAWIDRHFGLPDIARILASLAMETEAGAREWAEATMAVMRRRSPLSMAVSLEVVARGAKTMADCLRRDLNLAYATFRHGDVIEGVRARILDKDDRPAWRFAHIEDVTRADVVRMFASPWVVGEHPLRHLRD